MRALTDNTTLTVLDLADNECGVETARAMRLMAETNKTLPAWTCREQDATPSPRRRWRRRCESSGGDWIAASFSASRETAWATTCATIAAAAAMDGTLREMDLCATRAGPKAARASGGPPRAGRRWRPLPRWKPARRGGCAAILAAEKSEGNGARVSMRGPGTRPRRRTSCARHAARDEAAAGGGGGEEEKTEKTAAEEGQKSGAAPAAAPAVQVRQARRRRATTRRRATATIRIRARARSTRRDRTDTTWPRTADEGCRGGGGASLPTRGRRRRPGRPTRRERLAEWQNDGRGSHRAPGGRRPCPRGGYWSWTTSRVEGGAAAATKTLDDDAFADGALRDVAAPASTAARTTRNDSDALSRRVFHVRAGGEAHSRDGRRKRTRGGGRWRCSRNRVRGGRGGGGGG